MTSVAVFSHGHPFYSKGGGEIAAYNSFRAMRAARIDADLFCAVNAALKPDLAIFAPGEHIIEFNEHEYLFPGGHSTCSSVPTTIERFSPPSSDN